MSRPRVPQWFDVTTMLAPDMARYPADYQEQIKERMLTQLLRETHQKGYKWIGWPEFKEWKDDTFLFAEHRLSAGVWAVPA